VRPRAEPGDEETNEKRLSDLVGRSAFLFFRIADGQFRISSESVQDFFGVFNDLRDRIGIQLAIGKCVVDFDV